MPEAATAAEPRDLAGDKAQKIVAAMRAQVALRGVAGATFDHVAREAGVSRGLLHYYFSTKERLLVEVVRRDCDLRMEVLDAALSGARTADDFIAVLVSALEDTVANEPSFYALLFELCTLALRQDEIAAEVDELFRRTREHVAEQLAAKHEEGVIVLAAKPEDVASLLFALGDGIALQMLTQQGRDFAGVLQAGEACARALLT